MSSLSKGMILGLSIFVVGFAIATIDMSSMSNTYAAAFNDDGNGNSGNGNRNLNGNGNIGNGNGNRGALPGNIVGLPRGNDAGMTVGNHPDNGNATNLNDCLRLSYYIQYLLGSGFYLNPCTEGGNFQINSTGNSGNSTGLNNGLNNTGINNGSNNTGNFNGNGNSGSNNGNGNSGSNNGNGNSGSNNGNGNSSNNNGNNCSSNGNGNGNIGNGSPGSPAPC